MLIKIQDDFDPSLWEGLRNKNIFATGCTGFIGAWFIHSFVQLNEKYKLNAKLTLLTRNNQQLLAKYPVLKNAEVNGISFCEGDVTDFSFPNEKYDFVIHGATEVTAFQTGKDPSHLLNTALNGTKRIIEFCHAKDVKKVLFLSSGAAYGPMPLHIPLLKEELPGAPESSYGEAKRFSEDLLFKEMSFATSSARIFATCGPYLPMESSFAFSNILRDCISGKDIEISGNGKTTRSYLYAADLILWLWTLLLKGTDKSIYNVGSEEEISILELAKKMKHVLNSSSMIKVLGTELAYTRYIPSTEKIKKEFKLPPQVSLEEAILKSFEYYKGTL